MKEHIIQLKKELSWVKILQLVYQVICTNLLILAYAWQILQSIIQFGIPYGRRREENKKHSLGPGGPKKTSDLGPIVPLNFSNNSTCPEQVLTASGKISMKETWEATAGVAASSVVAFSIHTKISTQLTFVDIWKNNFHMLGCTASFMYIKFTVLLQLQVPALWNLN